MPIIGYKPNFNKLFRKHYDPKYDGNDYSQGANQAYYDKLMKQHKEREERRNAHTLSKVISSPSRRKSISTILSTHTDPLILGDFVIPRSNIRRSRSKSRSKSRSNDDEPPPISGGKSRRVFRRKMTSRRRQRRSTRSKHKH